MRSARDNSESSTRAGGFHASSKNDAPMRKATAHSTAYLAYLSPVMRSTCRNFRIAKSPTPSIERQPTHEETLLQLCFQTLVLICLNYDSASPQYISHSEMCICNPQLLRSAQISTARVKRSPRNLGHSMQPSPLPPTLTAPQNN